MVSRLLTTLMLCGLTLTPALLEAKPMGFQRTRSTLSTNLVLGDFFLGDVGAGGGLGMGLTLEEAIHSGYYGFAARVGFSYHGSEQTSLPFDRGFQAYHLAAGPRFYLPVWDDLVLIAQPEYCLVGFASNTLTESTGGRDTLHGAGLWMTLHYPLSSLVVGATVGVDYMPQVGGMMFMSGISIGLSSRI